MNDFRADLIYSLGEREKFDTDVLMNFFPERPVFIEKTTPAEDREGVDYVVHMRDGSSLTVDAKTRKPGASKWWNHGEPELCLERYSVVEKKRLGWLFRESSIHPNYILYTFDRDDTDRVYLIPYFLLRKATKIYGPKWRVQYGLKTQTNKSHGGYTSDAIFVPASVVLDAVKDCMSLGTAMTA